MARRNRLLSFILLFPLLLFFLSFSPPPLQAASPEIEKRFEKGALLFRQERDEEAEALFLKILQEDPTLIRPRNFLGLIYARTGRREEAVATFQKIIEIDPNYPGGYYGLGLVMKQGGEIDRAGAAFSRAVELAPKHVPSWLNLAQILEAKKEVEEAVSAYQRVIALGAPESNEVREARRRLDEIGEDAETARRIQDLLAAAAVKVKGGNPKEAIPFYEEAALLLPRGREILRILGEVAAQAGDLKGAEGAFQEAIQIDPAYLPARLLLGRLYQQTGRRREAIEAYEAILTIIPDERILEVRSAEEALFPLLDQEEMDELTKEGERLVKERRWEEALRAFQAAAGVDPESATARYNLARFYLQTEQYDLAREEAKGALGLEPDSRALYLLLGKIEQEQHYFLRSIGAYGKALSLSGKERGILYLDGLAGLIQSGFSFSKAQLEAILPFAEALAKKERREREEAEATLKGILLLIPEHPLPHFHLGEVYEKKGEVGPAVAEFEQAVALHPGFYPAWLSLARLYTQQKREASAITVYERLLRLPDPELKKLGEERGTVEKASRQAAERLKEAREKSRARFNQAQAALAEGKKEEGIALLLSGLEEEPDNLSLLNSLGIASASAGRWRESAAAFQKVLAADPSHIGARLRLAAVKEASGALLAARLDYQSLLTSGDPGIRRQAEERLARVKEALSRRREAERHEKRGIATLNLLNDPSAPRPDPGKLRLALWDLKRSVELQPEVARYHYNYGLLYQQMNAGTTDPQIIGEVIQIYQTAIEKEAGFAPAYLRLGPIYESQGEQEKAITLYQTLLSQDLNPEITEVKEIRGRLASLQKRLFGNIGYRFGIDSNFPLSTPPQDDSFNSLSADLTYYLLRGGRLQIPLRYQQETTFYYRIQTYFSSHGLSAGIQHRFHPSFSYGLNGRFQAGFAKGEWLSSLFSQATASLSRFGEIPSVASIEYNFSDTSFPKRKRLDAREHRGTLSLSHRIGPRDEGDLGYSYIDRQTPGSTDNSFLGHQFSVGYRRWIQPDLQLRGSGGALLQHFAHPDSEAGRRRENTLLFYSIGLMHRWSDATTLTLDHRWQRNRSNLGPAFLDEVDILLGRSSALGDYTKRVITLGVNIAF